MLKTLELLNKTEEKYHEMLKKVNIPDFTKCVAQFSGLEISEVSDKVIEEYLTTWAINKYRFFELFGKNTRIDRPISYLDTDRDITGRIRELEKQFPVWALWLEGFSRMKSNKISSDYFTWDFEMSVRRLFSHYNFEGSTITHFFKKQLNAPDELVTEIGKIFENQKIEATYTLSIDPVDMMLASENPYEWTSCYRLETPNDGSHADGCLAAILDSNVVISYIWNNEGEFKLYGKFLFKKIRYKRMRQWIAVSDSMSTLDFCAIYPGKDAYDKAFYRQLREYIETLIADFKGKKNTWKRIEDYKYCSDRENPFGYNEFGQFDLYCLAEEKPESIFVYTHPITCPCGCGINLMGSDNDDDYDYEYNGEGFNCGNFEKKYYCSLCDDYCDHDLDEEEDGYCRNCGYYLEEHPRCGLDEDLECEDMDQAYNYGDGGKVHSCEENCHDCPRWERYLEKKEEEEEK